MRKFFLLLLLLFPLPSFAFDACQPENYQPILQRLGKGLLYEIDKCGAEPSFVFGTMHTDEAALENLLPPVYKRLETAKSASFEIADSDTDTALAEKAMYYPPGDKNNLKSAIGDELYAKYKKIMERNFKLPEASYSKLRPWAAAVLLQYPESGNDGVPLDLRLILFAKEKTIPVFGLETAEQQMSYFVNLPEKTGVEMLEDTINRFGELKKETEKLSELYQNQNLSAMQKLAEISISEIDNPEIRELLAEKIINERNRKMADSLAPRLEEGGSFTAVGALHLPGEKGLLNLLEQRGYYIFPIISQ